MTALWYPLGLVGLCCFIYFALQAEKVYDKWHDRRDKPTSAHHPFSLLYVSVFVFILAAILVIG